MLTNHFLMHLIATFADELNELQISNSAFSAAAKRGHLDPFVPLHAGHNFSEVCNLICELVLPHASSYARVSFWPDMRDERRVWVSTGATSTIAGRGYLAALSRDSSKALSVFDTMVKKADKLGLTVIER